MALRLNGSNTGYVELDVPADAGSHTLILPDGGGTAHQVLKNSATAGTLEYGVTLPSGNGSAHQVLKNSATAGTLEYGLALPTGNGTSGQYLQTDGLGGSSWQTVTSTNTFGFTSLGETPTTSGSGHTRSGIPSSATEVIIIMSDISCNSSSAPHLLLQLGDGTIDTTNNYRWSLSYGGSYQATGGQPHIRLINTGATGAGNIYSGIIRIIPGTSNIQGTFTTHYHGASPNIGTFLYTGGTTLDRIQISSASTFDAGKFEVLHNGTP